METSPLCNDSFALLSKCVNEQKSAREMFIIQKADDLSLRGWKLNKL
jgi:hypothetical protein